MIANPLPLFKVINVIESRVPEFRRIVDGQHFFKSISPREEKGVVTYALSIAFLQDEVHFVKNLDQRILDAIVAAIEDGSLDKSLTDVAVNLSTWRRGAREK